jgi:LysR family hydrogen peroxide-inducible transcriptional activator
LRTLIKLADEGLGTTLLPYLHFRFKRIRQKKATPFAEPKPAHEVSLIFPRAIENAHH